MKQSLPRLAALCLSFATPALAQSYAAQVSALQPLTAQASYGTQVDTQTLPAGPLAASGSLAAAAFVSSAQLQWTTTSSDTRTTVNLSSSLLALSLPGNAGGAELGPNELLVEFQPMGTPSASLEILSNWNSLTGAPSVQIDLDNDGQIDIWNPTTNVALALPVGQIYQVRVVLESALPGPTQTGTAVANSYGTVQMTVRPNNNIFTGETVARCMNYGPFLTLEDAFSGTGLAIATYAPIQPSLLVIGFTPLAALLPIQASPLPCILLPQPDVLMLLPVQQTMTIPLPPAVRPATFYLQGVALSPQADLLGLSPGYTVFAQ